MSSKADAFRVATICAFHPVYTLLGARDFIPPLPAVWRNRRSADGVPRASWPSWEGTTPYTACSPACANVAAEYVTLGWAGTSLASELEEASMTTTPAAGPSAPADNETTLRLSRLLKRPVADSRGASIGRLADVIVRLRGSDYPLVTGLVAAVGGREIFVPIDQVSSFDGDPIRLSSARLSLRPFERREGEVLLRADVLGHRLIDVENARLVRAADLELAWDSGEWVLAGVDTRRRPRLTVRAARPGQSGRRRRLRDWHDFECRHRAREQRLAARAVRPHPQAEARPDRRPARERLQGRGDRDPRPGARGPRARGRCLRGTRRGPGHPTARRAHD